MTQEEINNLIAENQSLRKEISILKNSRSYKITKPLRILGRIARKIKHTVLSKKRQDVSNPEYLSRIADNRSYCQIPEEEYPNRLKAWFKELTGEELHLDNPQTFNEKLNWLKLYDKNPLKSLCADKFLAPKWAKKRCPELHTVKILKSWKHAKDIDFSKLPQKFALKCNHGSGMNIIVTDKSKLNIPEAVGKLNYWMQMDYAHWNHSFEIHYSAIPRRIICEEFIENEDEHGLLDYKIHCFNGEPKSIEVQFDHHEGQFTSVFFDINWNRLNITRKDKIFTSAKIPKPNQLIAMLNIAKKLSSAFLYVRVDLYELHNKVYFGEMTFTPGMCIFLWEPLSIDIEWGKYISLVD